MNQHHQQLAVSGMPCANMSLLNASSLVRHPVKKQRGFDLVQIAIVVGVIGVLMAGAFIGVPKVMAGVRATGEAQDLNAFVLAYSEIPATEAVSDAYIQTNRIYPASQAVTTGDAANTVTSFKNRFGGAITFTVADPLTTLVSPSVPTAACEKLIPIVAGAFNSVTVGTTPVKPVDGQLVAQSAYKAACRTPEGVVSITYTVTR